MILSLAALIAAGWQLDKDRDAAKMSLGEQCMLCTNPAWETQSKGLNQAQGADR
jgi:hypothetical protein